MRFLLDCHISKATLPAFRKRMPSVEAEHLANWRGGAFLRAGDEEILAACHDEERVFVTFDLRTVPDLLRRWAAEDRPHSGVVFGDEKSIRPGSPAAVARTLVSLAADIGERDTENMVRFLRVPER